MSVLAELDASLQALLTLKAPGVTKSRINSITTLCVENVKSESVIVQKFYTHFKRTPGSHKLGVLYVIDSVTRQWIEKAGNSTGYELVETSAPDGTYAAGIQKIANVISLMMNDTIASAPYDQKDKISKLIDIWERGNTFSASLITDFKNKVNERQPDPVEPAFPVQHTNQVETGQASHAQTTSTTPPGQPPVSSASATFNSYQQPVYVNGPYSQPTQANFPAAPVASVPPQSLPTAPAPLTAANITQDQIASLSAVTPQHILSDPVALQKHLGFLQQLMERNIPKEHWLAFTELMSKNGEAPMLQQPQKRDRSVSPTRQGGTQSSGSYRQRSPNTISTPTLQTEKMSLSDPKRPKWVQSDPDLPSGCIKVLSRTLFVGGTTLAEDELRDIFKQFGEVQTCIPNPEKRHAFIKYCYRDGAVKAREEMENITDPYMLSRVRSVRWGVGFGPRDCNDYNTGVSIIPISRLTEADRKWVLTAPYGGIGGQELKAGLVMEEPDIEIGAGVSSKAISRRLGEHETNRRPRGGGGANDYRGPPPRRHEREPPAPQHFPTPGAYAAPPVLPPQRYDPSVHSAMPGFGYPYPPGTAGMPPFG